MANKSITQLQVADPLTGLEPFPLVQNGITKQSLTADLALLARPEILNDITTPFAVFPLYSQVSSGKPQYIYASDPKYRYTPSLGLLEATVLKADNGIVINSATVTDSYTILSGDNGISAGPMTVASGATVTVSSNSVWTVPGVYSLAPWTFDANAVPSKLIVKRFGSALVSIDASGDITAFGTVNANGTP